MKYLANVFEQYFLPVAPVIVLDNWISNGFEGFLQKRIGKLTFGENNYYT